jgi:hypothetical protein
MYKRDTFVIYEWITDTLGKRIKVIKDKQGGEYWKGFLILLFHSNHFPLIKE